MNKLLSIGLATVGVLGLASPVNAAVCALVREGTVEIKDSQCRVYMSGSLDSEHNKSKTYLPRSISIVWSDGIKTNISLNGLISNGATDVGVSTVDGKGHGFTRFYNTEGEMIMGFTRLDDQLRQKTILIKP